FSQYLPLLRPTKIVEQAPSPHLRIRNLWLNSNKPCNVSNHKPCRLPFQRPLLPTAYQASPGASLANSSTVSVHSSRSAAPFTASVALVRHHSIEDRNSPTT